MKGCYRGVSFAVPHAFRNSPYPAVSSFLVIEVRCMQEKWKTSSWKRTALSYWENDAGADTEAGILLFVQDYRRVGDSTDLR
jgi:hypothetical protein